MARHGLPLLPLLSLLVGAWLKLGILSGRKSIGQKLRYLDGALSLRTLSLMS
ncbi:SUMF2 isoform 13 [Pan troglodytes]|uniref:SUMF2 isoform 13 n=1 Tax=Pan troglodytes TaxID=9598 RepID=A0A2J8JU40_PANTR|nr:SUMF2 isoform 13 [Pan troglodytes]